jgi:hypothetical protein
MFNPTNDKCKKCWPLQIPYLTACDICWHFIWNTLKYFKFLEMFDIHKKKNSSSDNTKLLLGTAGTEDGRLMKHHTWQYGECRYSYLWHQIEMNDQLNTPSALQMRKEPLVLTMNLTWSYLGLNPRLWGKTPAPNHLSYSMALKWHHYKLHMTQLKVTWTKCLKKTLE